jgi:hypothetical protein
MRSSDKFHAASLMPHMEDAQVVSWVGGVDPREGLGG